MKELKANSCQIKFQGLAMFSQILPQDFKVIDLANILLLGVLTLLPCLDSIGSFRQAKSMLNLKDLKENSNSINDRIPLCYFDKNQLFCSSEKDILIGEFFGSLVKIIE